MSRLPRFAISKRLRWLLIAAAGIGATAWAGGTVAATKARQAVNDKLAQRGLVLTAKRESWSPWGGVVLEQAELKQLEAPQTSVASLSNLHVTMEWGKAVSDWKVITRWQAADAKLVAHDEDGTVNLENFSTDFSVQNGTVDVRTLSARSGATSFDLKGVISTASGNPKPPPDEFTLRLKALRGVLRTLDFESAADQPFAVTGTFEIDARTRPWKWSVEAKGYGTSLTWKKLPMKEVQSQGTFSQDGMVVSNQIHLNHGELDVKVEREGGWKDTPLVLNGVLRDEEKREDAFRGTYTTASRRLVIDEMKGRANLVTLFQNLPALASRLPKSVTVTTFPDLLVKELTVDWQDEGGPPTWTLQSLQLRSPADLRVMVAKHVLKVDDVLGSVARQKKVWQIQSLKGKLLGGRFYLDGLFDGDSLEDSDIRLQSLQLDQFSPWVGPISPRLDDSHLTLAYRGAVCGRQPVRSTGSGSLVLTNAPVVQIPVLDAAYSLFPKLLPRKGSGGTGECEITFVMTKGIASIDPFKAKSESVTVTAKGTVDLVRRQVSGHARANLRGVVGVVTSPLSHVLTDMDIEGPLSDVRISPQGPVGAIKQTARAAKGGVKLGGKLVQTSLTLPLRALGMLDDD